MSQSSLNGAFPPSAPNDADANLHYALNSKVMVAAIIVLFLFIFFILLLHLYAKLFWQSSRSASPSLFIRRGITRSSVQPFLFHRGLDTAAIAQLPTFTYEAAQHGQEAGDEESMAPLLECAVCLSEFQENEKGRMLPSCKHKFHTECIDMWLFSHSTCPLCRTEVVTSPANAEVPETAGMEASPPTVRNPNMAASIAVQLPCNILFWGNEARVTNSSSSSTQEPASPLISASSSVAAAPPRTRASPQISIEIPAPAIEGGVLLTVSTPGRRPSPKLALICSCHEDQAAACSSQQQMMMLKSPGFRASFKRMLSRQSSGRHADGNEGSASQAK